MEPSKPILDYSSTAEEGRRTRAEEDERRRKLEGYNESTFGERRPIASFVLRLTLFLGVAALLMTTLPRRTGKLCAGVAGVAFVAWQWRAEGWPRMGGPRLRGW